VIAADQKKGTISKKKQLVVFVFCFLFALFTWFTSNQKQHFIKKQSVRIELQNVPPQLFFSSISDTMIHLELVSEKWFYNNSKNKIKTYNINMSDIQFDKQEGVWEGIYPVANIINEIQKQLPDHITIQKFSPALLFMRFETLNYKKVPLKYNFNYSLAPGHFLASTIVYDPDSITISGEKKYIDTIQHIETIAKEATLLKHSEIIDLTIQQPLSITTLGFSPNSAKVYIPVEEYSEKTIEIPIHINNSFHKNKTIKIFPSTVKITCMLSVESYHTYDAQHFKAEVDIPEDPNIKEIQIRITKKPIFAKAIKTNPSQVEYLLIAK